MYYAYCHLDIHHDTEIATPLGMTDLITTFRYDGAYRYKRYLRVRTSWKRPHRWRHDGAEHLLLTPTFLHAPHLLTIKTFFLTGARATGTAY